MKRMFKLSKILLLIVTVFSYVSSPISVLAEEIIKSEEKPLVLNLNAKDNGGVLEYSLTYISANPSDYEDEKTYKIELETSVTYSNGDEEAIMGDEITIDGLSLNSMRSSYVIGNPVSEYYNGDYVLSVDVYDEETLVYSEELEYENETNIETGLVGNLVIDEVVIDETTKGNYDVTAEGKYTQKLNVLTGELSPIGKYRLVYTLDDEVSYSDVMTGEVLRNTVITGTETDLTGKLFGNYEYTDSVTIEEVSCEVEENCEVVNTYVYEYDAVIRYGTDNDELFNTMYSEDGVVFEDGYVAVLAKDFFGNEEDVITIEELEEKLLDTEIVLSVKDEEEEVVSGEIKNGYVLEFTNGASSSYQVIVVGDADFDNDFDLDDLKETLRLYLDEEKMLSVDLNFEEIGKDENDESIYEEEGTITYKDAVVINELLKSEDADFEEKEIGSATVAFGEIPELIYVGDTLEVQLFVKADNLEDIIDGIDGTISGTNLKLDDISYAEFNSKFIGISNSTGRLVAIGSEALENDSVLVTFKFIATSEGVGTIDFVGTVYRFMSGSDVELTAEVKIERNISANNNLSSMEASAGKFDVEFDKDVIVYTLTVPYNTESVILSGAVEDVLSTVEGFVEYKLTEDKTTAIIKVIAEDGSEKIYTVYIVKEAAPAVYTPVVYYYSSNNYLKVLEIEDYEFEFDKYTNEYKINVKHDVTSLDIKALAEDSNARVHITGNENFKEGENIVIITVTAENGDTKEYKLIVTKEKKEQVVVEEEVVNNNSEKIVIVVLIVLVVLGLLYLIFKKDDEEISIEKNDEKINNKKKNN